MYDTLLLLRRVLPAGKIFAFIQEFALMAYLGKCIFSFLYTNTGGQLRWYMAVGLGMGIYVFRQLAAGYYLKYAGKLLIIFLSGGWKGHERRKCDKGAAKTQKGS